jgi:hypothetical protein
MKLGIDRSTWQAEEINHAAFGRACGVVPVESGVW